MATFPEQYKQLFGEELTFDPIDINAGKGEIPRPRMALPVGTPGGALNPAGDQSDFRSIFEGLPKPQPQEDFGGLGSAVAAGLKDVPAMGYGALEYGARQAEQGAEGSPVLREILADFRDWTTNKRQSWEQAAQESMARLSPEDISLYEKTLFTLDPEQSIFTQGIGNAARGIALKLARMAPPSLTSLVGTAVLQRAGITNGALAYAYASEAGMSLGAIQNNIANEIGAMDDQTLAENSKVFAELVRSGMEPTDARNRVIAEAQGAAPLIAGLTVGAISAAAARYMEPIFTKGANGNIVQRFGRGYAIEAPQEGTQGAAEQFAQNIAAQAYDADRSLGEGVLQAGLEEGALGGIFGGGVAAIAGRGSQPEVPPPEITQPDAAGPPPATFEQVFGRGGPAPVEGEGGQLGLPGIGPAVEQLPPTPEELEAGGQQALPFGPEQAPWLGTGLQQEIQYGPKEPQYEPGTQLPLRTVRQLPDGQGVMIDELEDTGPIQPSLPLDERREAGDRGIQESQEEMDREAASDVLGPSERQARTGDLFAGVTPVVRGKLQAAAERRRAKALREQRTTTTTRRREQGEVTGYEVETPKGTETFDTYEAASDRADEIIYAGGTANVRPVTAPSVERVRGQEIVTRAEKAPRLRRPVGEQRDRAVEIAAAVEEAVRSRSQETRKRRYGFLPGTELEFSDAGAEARYDQAFGELVNADITATTIEKEYLGRVRPSPIVTLYKQAIDRRKEAQAKLARIRTVSKPKARSERAAARVAELSPEAAADLTRRRGNEKEVEAADMTGFEHVDSSYFEKMSPDDVDKMHGQTLNEVFYRAAQVRAGSEYGAAVTYMEPSIVANLAEGSEGVATEGANRTVSVDEILAANKTDSKKRIYIRRLIQSVHRRKYGGKTKATKITSKAKRTKTSGGVQATRLKTGYFDTAALTRDTASDTERDESDDNRLKREELSRTQRKRLRTALDTGERTIAKFKGDEFQELLNEVDSFGNPTEDSFNLRYGGAYYRQIMQYGEALLKSEFDTSQAITEISKVSDFLERAQGMSAEKFAREMATIARAEERESLKSIGGSIRESTKKQITNPTERLASMADTNDRIRRSVGNLLRSTHIYRKNDVYQSAIAPLLRKFSDSIITDGYPSFQPTVAEMEAVKWALDVWKNRKNRKVRTLKGREGGTFYDEFYRPLKRYFQDLGYEFDEAGSLIVPTRQAVAPAVPFMVDVGAEISAARARPSRATDEVLSRKSKARGVFDEKTPVVERTKTIEQYYKEFQQLGELRSQAEQRADAKADAEQAARELAVQQEEQRADRVKRAEIPGRDAQINRIIEQFKARINHPRATIEGMVRQEQRLIRAFKEVGMWADTPSPALGKITHPTTGVTKSVPIVGPRLQAKKISKAEARKLMSKLTAFRLPKTDADISAEVQERAQQQLKAETEMFYKSVGVEKHGDAFVDAAVKVRQVIDSARTFALGHDVLDAIIENTPEGHPYNILATRLRAMNVTNIPVRWQGGQGTFSLPFSRLGVFRARESGRNFIMLNRPAFNRLNVEKGVDVASAATIHVTLHEMTHAATMNAIENDRGARQAFTQMQTIAKREFRNRGWKAPYGLGELHGVEEFVAEAFSNTAFQSQLKEIKYERTSVWARLLDLIRQVLGLPIQVTEETSLFDMVMATGDRLFVDSPFKSKESRTLNYEENIPDPVARRYVKLGDSFFSHQRVQSAIRQGKWAGIRAPLNLMTLPQIRSVFKDRLKGLDEYYRAFKRRDARNAELLEIAEKLSRQWTTLTEQNPAQAVEFSYVATQSTIHSVDPTKPLTDPANEHVTEKGQEEAHADLRAAFNELPDGFKKLWADLQTYYTESIDREAKLLTLNALRATLTKGGDLAPMTEERFDETFSFDRMSELDTKEKMQAELGELLEPETLATIIRMRTVAQKRQGPYFPIMRYGEYVVEAEKVHKPKSFANTKEARAWRDQRVAEDPTLEIAIRKAGDGTATATVKEKVFLLAESASEAQLKRDELVAEGIYDKVSAVTKKLDQMREATIQSNNALKTILDQLEGNSAAQAAIKQYYLRSLADSSFRKHEIRRKNRRGYDTKLQHRNFTNYAQASAYYTAQLEFGWQMADAMQIMREDVKATEGSGREGVRKSEVYQQIADRDNKTSDPMVINKMIRNGVSFAQFTMLTSPSYWMINATQPYMVSLPYMAAKFGMGQSAAALINAQKLIAHPLITQAVNTKGGFTALFKGQKSKTEAAFNVVDDVKEQIRQRAPERADEIIAMLDELRRESILDLSWIAELRDISEGRETGVWQRTLDASRIMSHLTEVNNRILTAIAAYNLASGTMSQEDAIEYTKEVVAGTHFDYSSGAKPMLFRPDGPLGAMAPLVFQFMQWPQHMYAMLITNMVKVFKAKGVERKEAAKIIGGLLGTHIVAGGLIGMMLQPIKWAMGLAMMALGDDDEPYTFQSAMSGETFDRYVQEGIANLVGPDIATLLSRGVPAALGTDLSDRMALGTLYFMDLRPETMESTLGSLAMSIGGPWLTIGESFGRATHRLFTAEDWSDVARAGEYIAPKAVRDLLKTVRYANEGLVNTRGDTVLDGGGVPPIELFLQSMGFSSATVSNFYNRQAAIKDMELYGRDRRQSLIDRFARATDTDGRQGVIREVVEFNKAFPSEKITRSTLLQSVTGKKEREASYRRYGANLRGEAQRYANEGWYFQ